MAKLDDASWHLNGGEFPPHVPEDNAATHIGFFVTWAIQKGLWGAPGSEREAAAAQKVRHRVITGRTFLLEECDGKLFPEMFSPVGRTFAVRYYEHGYFKDYCRIHTADLESDYVVEDTWENYERIAAVIEQQYQKALQKPWWKFW